MIQNFFFEGMIHKFFASMNVNILSMLDVEKHEANIVKGKLNSQKQLCTENYQAELGSSDSSHNSRPNSFWLGRHRSPADFFQMTVFPSTAISS